jgi:hypothetical protein
MRVASIRPCKSAAGLYSIENVEALKISESSDLLGST